MGTINRHANYEGRYRPPIDKGILYIIAGVVAVLVIVVGIKVGLESTQTTGIDLGLATSFAPTPENPANPG